jgi:hypothetical protein
VAVFASGRPLGGVGLSKAAPAKGLTVNAFAL